MIEQPHYLQQKHVDIVERLRKSPSEIAADLREHTPKADAVHMALGVAGETGELVDALKKWTIYGKPLDRANVVEELGDLEFYMQGIRAILGITREETLAANIEKLERRYHQGHYTDQQAQQRADKDATRPPPPIRFKVGGYIATKMAHRATRTAGSTIEETIDFMVSGCLPKDTQPKDLVGKTLDVEWMHHAGSCPDVMIAEGVKIIQEPGT